MRRPIYVNLSEASMISTALQHRQAFCVQMSQAGDPESGGYRAIARYWLEAAEAASEMRQRLFDEWCNGQDTPPTNRGVNSNEGGQE